MSDALLPNAELLKQNRDAVVRRGLTRFVDTPETPRVAVGTFVAGMRVFDTVSGEEGEVVHGARENVVVPTPK